MAANKYPQKHSSWPIGAEEQACSIEKLAAAVNEISEHVRETKENANEARGQTDQAGEQVFESNQQMQEMIRAMNIISEKSSEIYKIVKTIEDIAFQTNILALMLLWRQQGR